MIASVVGLLLAACGSPRDAHAATNGNATARGDAGADGDDAADPNSSAGTAHADTHARAPRRDGRAHANNGGGPDANARRFVHCRVGAPDCGGPRGRQASHRRAAGGVSDIAPIYKLFEDKFGVKVVLGRGSSTEHANRILAEQSAGRFTVDVAHSGANSANVRYIANGMAQPIAPWIFHPEAASENWFGDRWWFTDDQEQYHFCHDLEPVVSLGRGLLVEHQQPESRRGGVLHRLVRFPQGRKQGENHIVVQVGGRFHRGET